MRGRNYLDERILCKNGSFSGRYNNSFHIRICLVQTVTFGSFGCSPSTSSDFAEIHQNHAKKLDLAERIRMHRSRASGASNLSRYVRFCAHRAKSPTS